jgi:hypothetical protein
MRRLKIGAAALLAVSLLAVAGVASAVVVKGRGELTAAGNGAAVLVFRGGANLGGIGLAVVEEDAIAGLDGHGRITPLGDGRVLLEGFGRIEIRSPDERTRVEIAGARLRIRARGVGVAWLKGVGHYMTDDRSDSWSDDLQLEFEE